MADRNALPAGLLDDVKNYLNITWSDEGTDKKVGALVASGIAYLDGKLGSGIDYTLDGMPRTLLLDYVRYMRDGALDIFESNYRSLIIAAQNERRVKAYAQSTDTSE